MGIIDKIVITSFILLTLTSIAGMCTEGNDKLQKILTIIAIILGSLLVLSLLILIWMI